MSHICPKAPHVNLIQPKATLINIFTRGWHLNDFYYVTSNVQIIPKSSGAFSSSLTSR